MQGLVFKNASGQILISGSTKSLHYHSHLLPTDATLALFTDLYGSVKVWRYTVTCASFPVVFFRLNIIPIALTRVQDNGNGTWLVEVLTGSFTVNGTQYLADAPHLKIFAMAESVANSADTHGLLVRCPDMSISYDSRKRPLAILGTATALPPATATDVAKHPPEGSNTPWCVYDYSASDTTHNEAMRATNSVVIDIPVPAAGFHTHTYCSFTAVHQHEREFNYSGETSGNSGFPFYTPWTTYWLGKYWALYRSAVYLPNPFLFENFATTAIKIGWTLQDRGWQNSNYTNTFDSWSQSSNNNAGYLGGKPPLTSETINQTPCNAIFIDGGLYDGTPSSGTLPPANPVRW